MNKISERAKVGSIGANNAEDEMDMENFEMLAPRHEYCGEMGQYLNTWA